jgi:hypothetical protein
MTDSRPHNIVFILTDQERYFREYPLFDLSEDPQERTNLAALGSDYDDLIGRLNQRMNDLIGSEVGPADDGRYLPDLPGVGWVITEFKTI